MRKWHRGLGGQTLYQKYSLALLFTGVQDMVFINWICAFIDNTYIHHIALILVPLVIPSSSFQQRLPDPFPDLHNLCPQRFKILTLYNADFFLQIVR